MIFSLTKANLGTQVHVHVYALTNFKTFNLGFASFKKKKKELIRLTRTQEILKKIEEERIQKTIVTEMPGTKCHISKQPFLEACQQRTQELVKEEKN